MKNILVLSFLSLLMLTACNNQGQKIGYIEVFKVYDEFELKKIKETEFKQVENQRKLVLDSLRLNLQMLENKLKLQSKVTKEQEALFGNKYNQYQLKERELTENNKALAAKLEDEIFTQLNQYVKEYGDENGYDFILGGNGSGTIMQAKESNDLTEEMIQYVNSRFNGKK